MQNINLWKEIFTVSEVPFLLCPHSCVYSSGPLSYQQQVKSILETASFNTVKYVITTISNETL
jgi:hypothetical protein